MHCAEDPGTHAPDRRGYDEPPMSSPAQPVRITVQLRHELPDGTWHIDWMLARHGQAEREQPLVTFRVPARVDELQAGGAVIDAERIADHRPAFLRYEGPISRGRGEVKRVCQGEIRSWIERAEGWDLEVAWCDSAGGKRRQRLRLRRHEDHRWSVQAGA